MREHLRERRVRYVVSTITSGIQSPTTIPTSTSTSQGLELGLRDESAITIAIATRVLFLARLRRSSFGEVVARPAALHKRRALHLHVLFAAHFSLGFAFEGVGVDGVEGHGAGGGVAVHEVDELGKDVEFEAQFDAVHEAFDGFLVELVVFVLEDYEGDLMKGC